MSKAKPLLNYYIYAVARRYTSAKRVTRVLDRILATRGKLNSIRVDNGPEFTSTEFCLWCKTNNIIVHYIQPGKPMQNGYVERFNCLYREAVLDVYLFFDPHQVRELTQAWLEEYNQRRPHEALNNLTPEEWKNMVWKKRFSRRILFAKRGTYISHKFEIENPVIAIENPVFQRIDFFPSFSFILKLV